MTAAFNPAEAARLAAELREDDARMTPGPWWGGGGSRRWMHLEGDDADAVARLRNNARATAEQLEAASAEIARLKSDAANSLIYATADRGRALSDLEHVRGVLVTVRRTLCDGDAWANESAETAATRVVAELGILREQREAAIATIADLSQHRTGAGEALVVVTAERDRLRSEVERIENVSKGLAGSHARLRAEVERLTALINTPRTDEFFEAVRIESAHQVERWGVEHDAGKRSEDWVTLMIYLLGKAANAHFAADRPKLEHHVITTAAVALNWWRRLVGVSFAMRPGVAPREPAIACSTCDDTHMMPLGENTVMCTRCPTPCERCAGSASGAYCRSTPCACDCHAVKP